MKNKVIFTFIFLFAALRLLSQNVEVVKSNKIELIGGKQYYIHQVQKKQTVYAIAKAYQVSEDEIYEANPDAKKGLKVDSYLRIPAKDVKNQETTKTTYIYHTVVKGETLYSLSKKYQTTVETLQQENPELSQGLKEGMHLKIPRDAKIEPQKDIKTEENKKVHILHTVEKGETLYSISKKYGVTINEINAANPTLTDGLKAGIQLSIYVAKSNVPKDAVLADDVLKKKDTILLSKPPSLSYCDNPTRLKSYNVALLLPFYTDLSYKISTSAGKAQDYESFSYIQYYEGILVAADSMKQKGFSMKLFVYDITDDTIALKTLLAGSEMKQMHLIIGPVNNAQLEIVKRFSAEHKIKVVTTQIANANQFRTSPYFFNAAPSVLTQLKEISSYLTCTYPKANFILIHNNRENEKEIMDSIKFFVNSGLKQMKTYGEIKEIIFSAAGIDGIKSSLNADRDNILITMINGEVFVSDYVRKLSELTDPYKITVVGMPSWRSFERIEVEYFHKLNLHLFTSSFVDYEDTLTKSFVLNFRKAYKIDPDLQAFQGYDHGLYFFSALHNYGLYFEKCLENQQLKLLQNNILFKPTGENSFENKQTIVFKYADYKMINVRKDTTIKE